MEEEDRKKQDTGKNAHTHTKLVGNLVASLPNGSYLVVI